MWKQVFRALPVRQGSLPMNSLARTSTRVAHLSTQAALERVRNVGIIAHIDAGKTTTTERMLYYSGTIRSVGEVHDGDTVMDFMEQERERGITIGAACISFSWQDYSINLIDTPGHVDFTVEVERAARVLDGGVAVFDGVAGVEAQTETVWEQADRYGVPRIAFVNKLDRDGASLAYTAKTMQARLRTTPLLVQYPIGESETFRGTFPLTKSLVPDAMLVPYFYGTLGVVDLIEMEVLEWTDKMGDEVRRLPLSAVGSGGTLQKLKQSCIVAREKLIETAAEFDDDLATLYLENPEEVTPSDLKAALRRITLNPRSGAVVTLCGSALKNKGVQPLLDAIIEFLPSPIDKGNPPATRIKDSKAVMRRPDASEPLSALAFKVQYESQRGAMVFFRVYSGSLKAKSTLYNVTRKVKERPTRLLRINAKSTEEIDEISAGYIGAAIGLKHTCTGDTIILANDKEQILLENIKLPEPVFSASLELESAAYEKDLKEALEFLQREDPSAIVTYDEETGQTLLSGMGELHLEIMLDRLQKVYKVPVSMGTMRVAYRESIRHSASKKLRYEKFLQTKRQFAQLEVHVEPLFDANGITEGAEIVRSVEVIKASRTTSSGDPEEQPVLSVPKAILEAVAAGAQLGLNRGPVLSYPLMGVKVTIHESDIVMDEDSSPAAFTAAASQAVMQAIREADPLVFEPLVKLEIRVPQSDAGTVLSDLNSTRRAVISDVVSDSGKRNDYVAIFAETPVSSLIGYATAIRSMTAGEGGFSSRFVGYRFVGAEQQKKMVNNPPH